MRRAIDEGPVSQPDVLEALVSPVERLEKWSLRSTMDASSLLPTFKGLSDCFGLVGEGGRLM